MTKSGRRASFFRGSSAAPRMPFGRRSTSNTFDALPRRRWRTPPASIAPARRRFLWRAARTQGAPAERQAGEGARAGALRRAAGRRRRAGGGEEEAVGTRRACRGRVRLRRAIGAAAPARGRRIRMCTTSGVTTAECVIFVRNVLLFEGPFAESAGAIAAWRPSLDRAVQGPAGLTFGK